jgi:hypothetical protein
VQAAKLGLDAQPRQLANPGDLGAKHQQVQQREQAEQGGVGEQPKLRALAESEHGDGGLESDREGDHEGDRARAREAGRQHRQRINEGIERTVEAVRRAQHEAVGQHREQREQRRVALRHFGLEWLPQQPLDGRVARRDQQHGQHSEIQRRVRAVSDGPHQVRSERHAEGCARDAGDVTLHPERAGNEGIHSDLAAR